MPDMFDRLLTEQAGPATAVAEPPAAPQAQPAGDMFDRLLAEPGDTATQPAPASVTQRTPTGDVLATRRLAGMQAEMRERGKYGPDSDVRQYAGRELSDWLDSQRRSPMFRLADVRDYAVREGARLEDEEALGEKATLELTTELGRQPTGAEVGQRRDTMGFELGGRQEGVQKDYNELLQARREGRRFYEGPGQYRQEQDRVSGRKTEQLTVRTFGEAMRAVNSASGWDYVLQAERFLGELEANPDYQALPDRQRERIEADIEARTDILVAAVNEAVGGGIARTAQMRKTAKAQREAGGTRLEPLTSEDVSDVEFFGWELAAGLLMTGESMANATVQTHKQMRKLLDLWTFKDPRMRGSFTQDWTDWERAEREAGRKADVTTWARDSLRVLQTLPQFNIEVQDTGSETYDLYQKGIKLTGHTVGYMAPAVITGGVLGAEPAASVAFVTGMSVGFNETFQRATADGVSEDKAFGYSLAAGILYGAVEQLQLKQIRAFAGNAKNAILTTASTRLIAMAKKGVRLTKTAVAHAFREGVEEGAQFTITEAGAIFAGAKPKTWQEFEKQIADEFLAGAGMGVIFAGLGGVKAATKAAAKTAVRTASAVANAARRTAAEPTQTDADVSKAVESVLDAGGDLDIEPEAAAEAKLADQEGEKLDAMREAAKPAEAEPEVPAKEAKPPAPAAKEKPTPAPHAAGPEAEGFVSPETEGPVAPAAEPVKKPPAAPQAREAAPQEPQAAPVTEEVPAKADVLTFDEFSQQRGVATRPPSFPEGHRQPRRPSKQAQKQFEVKVGKALDAWQAKRDALRTEYASLIEAGKLREPTTKEQLQATAAGEGEQAEAATRALAAREAAKAPAAQPAEGKQPTVAKTAPVAKKAPAKPAQKPTVAKGEKADRVERIATATRQREINRMGFTALLDLAKSRRLVKDVAAATHRQLRDAVLADEGLLPEPKVPIPERPVPTPITDAATGMAEAERLLGILPGFGKATAEAKRARAQEARDLSKEVRKIAREVREVMATGLAADIEAMDSAKRIRKLRAMAQKLDKQAEMLERGIPAAPKAEKPAPAKPAAKRIISQEAIDKAWKDLGESTVLGGIPLRPKHVKAVGVILLGHFETGVRKLGAMIKVLVPKLLKANPKMTTALARRYVRRAWRDTIDEQHRIVTLERAIRIKERDEAKRAKAEAAKVERQVREARQAAGLAPLQAQLAAGHMLKARLSLDDDSYQALAQETTGKTSMANMTQAEAKRFIGALQSKVSPKAEAKVPERPAWDQFMDTLAPAEQAQLSKAAGASPVIRNRLAIYAEAFGALPESPDIRRAYMRDLVRVARSSNRGITKQMAAASEGQASQLNILNPWSSMRYAVAAVEAKTATRLYEPFTEAVAASNAAEQAVTKDLETRLKTIGQSMFSLAMHPIQNEQVADWLFEADAEARGAIWEGMDKSTRDIAKVLHEWTQDTMADSIRGARWILWDRANRRLRPRIDALQEQIDTLRANKPDSPAIPKLENEIGGLRHAMDQTIPANAPASALEAGRAAKAEGRLDEWIAGETWGTRAHYYMAERDTSDFVDAMLPSSVSEQLEPAEHKKGIRPQATPEGAATRKEGARRRKGEPVIRALMRHHMRAARFVATADQMEVLLDNFAGATQGAKDLKILDAVVRNMLGEAPEGPAGSITSRLLAPARGVNRLFWRTYLSAPVTAGWFASRNLLQNIAYAGAHFSIPGYLKAAARLVSPKTRAPGMAEWMEESWKSRVSQRKQLQHQMLLLTESNMAARVGTRAGLLLDQVGAVTIYSDELNRFGVAPPAYQMAYEVAKKYQDGKLSWSAVERKLKLLNILPQQRLMLARLAAEGNLKDFAGRYAEVKTENINFKYETPLRAGMEQTVDSRLVLGLYTYMRGVWEQVYWNGVRPTVEGARAGNWHMMVAGVGMLAKLFLGMWTAKELLELIGKKAYGLWETLLNFSPTGPGYSKLLELFDSVQSAYRRSVENDDSPGDTALKVVDAAGDDVAGLIPFADSATTYYETAHDEYGVRTWRLIKKLAIEAWSGKEGKPFKKYDRTFGQSLSHAIWGGFEKPEKEKPKKQPTFSTSGRTRARERTGRTRKR